MRAYLLLLLLGSLAFAQAEGILVEPIKAEKNTVAPGEILEFKITVYNPSSGNITANLNIYGEQNSWANFKDNPTRKLKVPAKSSAEAIVAIQPPASAPVKAYSIEVEASLEGKGSIRDSRSFPFFVKGAQDVTLETSANRKDYYPGDTIEITSKVENIGNIEYSVLFVNYALSRSGELAWSDSKVVTALSPKGSDTTGASKQIDRSFFPGKYLLVSYVSDKESGGAELARSTAEIIVRDIPFYPVSNMSLRNSTVSEFMRRQITYELENKGNVVESRTIIHQFSWLESKFLSSNENYIKAGGLYIWDISLRPGEQKTLTITTYGAVLTVVYLLAVTIFLLLAFIAYRAYTMRPKIALEKKISRIRSTDGAIELSLALIVRNMTKERMENIIVTDAVPKTHNVRQFSTATPAQVNERRHEIEYVWTIDHMKPYEERVLIYHIIGSIGEFSLPSASAQARNEQGRLYFAKSISLAFSPEGKSAAEGQ